MGIQRVMNVGNLCLINPENLNVSGHFGRDSLILFTTIGFSDYSAGLVAMNCPFKMMLADFCCPFKWCWLIFLFIAGKKSFKHFHEDERWEISEPLQPNYQSLSDLNWRSLYCLSCVGCSLMPMGKIVKRWCLGSEGENKWPHHWIAASCHSLHMLSFHVSDIDLLERSHQGRSYCCSGRFALNR